MSAVISKQISLSPKERYEYDLKQSGFIVDTTQRQAICQLEYLYKQLIERQVKKKSLFYKLFDLFSSAKQPLKGLYFWGGVGRGKTYLMDIFYESLPFENKLRVHFHRFMRRVHHDLSTLSGQKNPLEQVAQRLADEACIICFDEFFVSDITDAMILAGLLNGLFQRGVTLVATSNIVPDGLYKDGLQRERFLPAIALLNLHTEVVNVDGGTDYRLRCLEQAELYHSPLDEQADASLYASFESLIPDKNKMEEGKVLEIEGRSIISRYHCEDVVWFDFAAVCEGPRSQNDYIEIAKEYHAVLLSDVPELTINHEEAARRFINLVDEFYDRSVKLIISADRVIHALYSGQRLVFEFERTVSRLLEMQSYEYLSRAHKP